jgi:predicted solute-binding protein
MTDNLQELTLGIINIIDKIARQKIKWRVAIMFWEKMGKPFVQRAVLSMTEEELKTDLNLIYKRLKPHFEKKQLKDMLDEADRLSGIKLKKLNNSQFNEASKYF